MGDTAQDRYVAHQARKAAVLEQVAADTIADIMENRHSIRRYTREPISDTHLKRLLDAAKTAPSSCDRQAITVTPITARDDLALLGGLLVGGVGWVHRAPLLLLLTADPTAYKAPGEIDRLGMPQLDAAHVSQSILLTAVSLNLGACFVNPNIRERDVPHFHAVFGPGLLCGAVAVGHPVEWSV